MNSETSDAGARAGHTRVVQGLRGCIWSGRMCYKVADLPPRILGFEFTDGKFLGNDRFIFCFNKARNVLLKRKQRRIPLAIWRRENTTHLLSPVFVEFLKADKSVSPALSMCSVEETPMQQT